MFNLQQSAWFLDGRTSTCFILVCLLYILGIHSAQNVIGAYVIVMLVYRHLLTTGLQASGKAAV